MSNSTTSGYTVTLKDAVKYIQSRTQVNEPGKYSLQVISANAYQNKIILGLKAQASDALVKATQHLRDKEYRKGANLNMTTSVFADASFIPSKGEFITCMVDYVTARDGSQVLGVVSVSEIKARSTKKVNLGDEFANLLDEMDEDEDETTEHTPD